MRTLYTVKRGEGTQDEELYVYVEQEVKKGPITYSFTVMEPQTSRAKQILREVAQDIVARTV